MTSRSTYESTSGTSATPTSAASTRVVSNIANAVTLQETINVAILNNGKNLARGVSAADDITIRNAAATYVAAKQKAAMIEQVTIQAAKDTLRSTGDLAPA